MEQKKTDLRVIRTRKAIRDAFCSMIMEMDYPDITIKELTQRAMINRNTFYLHYDSLDALLRELQGVHRKAGVLYQDGGYPPDDPGVL